ncbi:hypothetical protein B0T26DRAFT_733306, partial [Lasiosphaeria miniovina]
MASSPTAKDAKVLPALGASVPRAERGCVLRGAVSGTPSSSSAVNQRPPLSLFRAALYALRSVAIWASSFCAVAWPAGSGSWRVFCAARCKSIHVCVFGGSAWSELRTALRSANRSGRLCHALHAALYVFQAASAARLAAWLGPSRLSVRIMPRSPSTSFSVSDQGRTVLSIVAAERGWTVVEMVSSAASNFLMMSVITWGISSVSNTRWGGWGGVAMVSSPEMR